MSKMQRPWSFTKMGAPPTIRLAHVSTMQMPAPQLVVSQ
jgi:hypothetical protein